MNLLVNGGRIASSDENAIFLLTQSIATRGALDVPAGIVDNGSTFDGRFYIWYEVGQSLITVPLYWIAAGVSQIVHVPPTFQTLFLKAVVGAFNAVIGALIAVLMFAFGRKLGYTGRTSLMLTLALCVSSFAFPYFKSFLREPLLMLCLSGASYFLLCWREEPESSTWPLLIGVCAGLGILTKITFALNVALFLLYIVVVARKRMWRGFAKSIVSFAFPVTLAAVIILLYNYLRFGNAFDLGYKGGTAFSTPLYVGLFGLLLSSGKGLIFYAPIVVVGFVSFRELYRRFSPEVLLWMAIIGVNVLLHAKYIAWAGDGSWGPRYLVPILALVILPAGEVLERGSTIARRFCHGLIVIGIIIQLGGTTIYAGNYLREIGEYPYTKSFDDPEFLYRAHFIPDYSPIVGHWRMAIRNIGEHLSGNAPLLRVTEEMQSKRIPVGENQQSMLRHTLDYWFYYPYYIGYRSLLLVFVPVILLVLVVFQFLRLRMLVRRG
ncbi:MAG: phospholipid carrier-dependent glycosyltransferase [Ignavibacteriae bacterium]|nr:phospholipid carrier-dependent glycosyltransferase [Ignavibacteriota bacterium]